MPKLGLSIRRISSALALLVLAGLSGVGLFGTGSAGADALCDQMRDQYGPGWPCISVPTNTPPPAITQPPPEAPGAAVGGGGANIGGSPGPGPGQGNGTPIVGGAEPEATPQPRTASPGGDTPPRNGEPPATVQSGPGPQPDTPGVPAGGPQVDPNELVDVVTDAGNGTNLVPSGTRSPGAIPVELWLLIGGAAAAAGAARPWLKRGGSTRADVGPSRLVLIHDESSPNTYKFDMDVPKGGSTRVNPDGSATVYDRDGKPVRHYAPPWALDSLGRPQRTWYEVDENGDLVQHVEPADDALYPILADPWENAAPPMTEEEQIATFKGMPSPNQPAQLTPEESKGQALTGLVPRSDEPALFGNEQLPQGTLLAEGAVQPQPATPGAGELRTAPGQGTGVSGLSEQTGIPVPGTVMERGLGNGETELIRVDTNPEGENTERRVVETDNVDGQDIYTFEDGSFQIGLESFTPDGRIEGGHEWDRIEDGERVLSTYDSSGELRNERFYHDSGFVENIYDSEGKLTAKYFRDSDGDLVAGTLITEDSIVNLHPDGSTTVFRTNDDGLTGEYVQGRGGANGPDWKAMGADAAITAQAEGTKFGIDKLSDGKLSPTDTRIKFGLTKGPLIAGLLVGTTSDIRSGDMSVEEAVVTNTVGLAAGYAAGTYTGGLVGASLGSVVPGVGTAAGFVVGAVVGWAVTEFAQEVWPSDDQAPMNVAPGEFGPTGQSDTGKRAES